MKCTMKQLGLAAACAVALGVLSGTAGAQVRSDEHALVTSPGGAPVMSGFGLCVRSGFGPAPAWNQQCHAYSGGRVTFDANVLFDSDKSTLAPAGRNSLDQFANKVHGLDDQSILAIGYADRMGTHPSNQELSQERVDVVRAYLVGRGIAANRIQTQAKGETHPTTYWSDCNEGKNAQNVACLQPDRHVYIQATGNTAK